MTVILKKQKYNNNLIEEKQNLKPIKHIEFSALLFGIYTAIIPLNQIMNFIGSGTINRYLGILVIVSILINILLKKQVFLLKREYISILLFTTFAFISYFWSINQLKTIRGIVSFLSLVFFYLVCSSKIYTNSEKTFIKVCSIIGGLLLSLYFINKRGLYYNRVFLIISNGQVADPNGLSSSIAFGVLFLFDYLLRMKGKIKVSIIVFSIIIMIYGMLLTGSRGGILGLLMGVSILMILGILKKEIPLKKVFMVVLYVFIFLLIVFSVGISSKYISIEVLERMTISNVLETGGTGRFTIWKYAIQAIFERPVFGYGFISGPYVLNQYYSENIGTHNDVLFLLLGTGIIGLILFINFLFRIIKSSVLKSDVLTLSMIVMVIAFGLSLDYIFSKNFWNVMIYSSIGIGVINPTVQKSTNINQS